MAYLPPVPELVEPTSWLVRVRHSTVPVKSRVVMAIDEAGARKVFAEQLPPGTIPAGTVLEVKASA